MLTHAMSEDNCTRPEMDKDAGEELVASVTSNLRTRPPLQQRMRMEPFAEALVMRSNVHGQITCAAPPKRTSEAVTWKYTSEDTLPQRSDAEPISKPGTSLS